MNFTLKSYEVAKTSPHTNMAANKDDLKLQLLDLGFDIRGLEEEIRALEARLAVYDSMFTEGVPKSNKKRTWVVHEGVEDENVMPKHVRSLLR